MPLLQVRAILEAIPAAPGTRQTLMFSATWPEGVRKIADEFLVDPVKLVIGSPGEWAVGGVLHRQLALSASIVLWMCASCFC